MHCSAALGSVLHALLVLARPRLQRSKLAALLISQRAAQTPQRVIKSYQKFAKVRKSSQNSQTPMATSFFTGFGIHSAPSLFTPHFPKGSQTLEKPVRTLQNLAFNPRRFFVRFVSFCKTPHQI
jgi:hypothetical protein